MRSLVLFIGCSLCVSLAAYLAVQIIWGSSATAEAPKLTTVSYPILQKEGQAGDIIRLSDMTWVTQTSAEEMSGLVPRKRLDQLTGRAFGISRDYHEGDILLAEHVIWPEDPDFIAQILRTDHRAIAVHFTDEMSSNLSFGMGAFVDLYLINLNVPVLQSHEELVFPLKLAASLRVIGVQKNTQLDSYLMVEGTDLQIKSVLKGMAVGSLKAVLTTRHSGRKGEEPSIQALRKLKPLDAANDRSTETAQGSAITIQRGAERDVMLFSSSVIGQSR